MSHQSKRARYCSTGDYLRTGQKFCMDGCVYDTIGSSLTTSDRPCSPKATTTGQLSTILTFYEITDPPIESPLTGIPLTLLRRAITILGKTGRAQIIGVADGEGVRFFPGTGKP